MTDIKTLLAEIEAAIAPGACGPCDCALSHNGVGLSARDCDCAAPAYSPQEYRAILDHIKALEAENAKLRGFVSSLVHMQSGDGWTRAIVREAAADLLRDIGAPITPMADTTPAFVARAALGGDNG